MPVASSAVPVVGDEVWVVGAAALGDAIESRVAWGCTVIQAVLAASRDRSREYRCTGVQRYPGVIRYRRGTIVTSTRLGK